MLFFVYLFIRKITLQIWPITNTFIIISNNIRIASTDRLKIKNGFVTLKLWCKIGEK